MLSIVQHDLTILRSEFTLQQPIHPSTMTREQIHHNYPHWHHWAPTRSQYSLLPGMYRRNQNDTSKQSSVHWRWQIWRRLRRPWGWYVGQSVGRSFWRWRWCWRLGSCCGWYIWVWREIARGIDLSMVLFEEHQLKLFPGIFVERTWIQAQ